MKKAKEASRLSSPASTSKKNMEENNEKPLKQERSYGAVVINLKGEVLIEYMKLGHVSLPKGHIENGETPVMCAKREIKEETGLEVEIDTSFQAEESYSPFAGVWKKVTFFLASPLNGDLTPQEEEVQALKWLKPAQAIAALTFEGDKQVLLKALKAKKI
jgi:bis(5'-nucleosidyl)-tetraphosphatase